MSVAASDRSNKSALAPKPQLRRFVVYAILEVTVDESAVYRPDAVPAVAAELAREALAQHEYSVQVFPLSESGFPLAGAPLVFEGPHPPRDKRVIDRVTLLPSSRRRLLTETKPLFCGKCGRRLDSFVDGQFVCVNPDCLNYLEALS